MSRITLHTTIHEIFHHPEKPVIVLASGGGYNSVFALSYRVSCEKTMIVALEEITGSGRRSGSIGCGRSCSAWLRGRDRHRVRGLDGAGTGFLRRIAIRTQ